MLLMAVVAWLDRDEAGFGGTVVLALCPWFSGVILGFAYWR